MTAVSQSRSPGDDAPPPGAPWDVPFEEATFAFLDLEMTGLRVGVDRVVEVCIERVRGGAGGVGGTVEARIDSLVDPAGVHGAEHVHGLAREALAAAPTFASIAAEVARALDGAIVVAHAAAWDLAFLDDELKRAGLVGAAPTHAVDTLVLCRRALHLHGYGLQNVAAALKIPVARAHRAGDDVATMRAIWPTLVEALKPTTPRDLWSVRIGERTPRPEVVAAIERAIASAVPVDVTYRPAKRGAERLSMMITSLVSPYAIGYLLPGRGHRELRVDRILRIDSALAESAGNDAGTHPSSAKGEPKARRRQARDG